jgi:hypothetical protein
MPLPDTWLRLFAMQMGYSKLRGYVEFEASVAGNPGVMSIDQLDFTVLNAAAVYATAELESVGPASNEQSAKLHRSDVSFPSEGLLLRAATLRIEDNSLTKRALALIVGWQDISPEMASLQAQAGFGLTFGPLLGPQGSVEAATTFKKFLDNPGALDISIATKKPIPLEALFDPSAYPRVAPDVEVSFTLDE